MDTAVVWARPAPTAIRRPPGSGPYLEVPPDVTAGRVVVVVGGLVVVVVGLVVVVVGAAPSWPEAPVVVVGMVVDVVDVVDVVLGDAAGTVLGAGGAVAGAVPPGCSLATVTPMSAAAPPASTTAVLVKREIRACALERAPGVCWSRARLAGTLGAVARRLVRSRPDRPRQDQRTRSVPDETSTSRWNLERRLLLQAERASG